MYLQFMLPTLVLVNNNVIDWFDSYWLNMSSTTGVQSTGGMWSWPNIIGFTMEDAMMVILRYKPDADIVFLPVGSPVTTDDFRPNRVRIFLDTIIYPPRVG